jgi:hypothetical protein
LNEEEEKERGGGTGDLILAIVSTNSMESTNVNGQTDCGTDLILSFLF